MWQIRFTKRCVCGFVLMYETTLAIQWQTGKFLYPGPLQGDMISLNHWRRLRDRPFSSRNVPSENTGGTLTIVDTLKTCPMHSGAVPREVR